MADQVRQSDSADSGLPVAIETPDVTPEEVPAQQAEEAEDDTRGEKRPRPVRPNRPGLPKGEIVKPPPKPLPKPPPPPPPALKPPPPKPILIPAGKIRILDFYFGIYIHFQEIIKHFCYVFISSYNITSTTATTKASSTTSTTEASSTTTTCEARSSATTTAAACKTRTFTTSTISVPLPGIYSIFWKIALNSNLKRTNRR